MNSSPMSACPSAPHWQFFRHDNVVTVVLPRSSPTLVPACLASSNRTRPQNHALYYQTRRCGSRPISFESLMFRCVALVYRSTDRKRSPRGYRGGSAAEWRRSNYGVNTPVACKTCGDTPPSAILSRSRVRLVLGSTNQILPLLSISTMSSRSRKRNSSGFWRND